MRVSWSGRPMSSVSGLTELAQHIGNILPIHDAVAVAVQDLKAFPQRPDL